MFKRDGNIEVTITEVRIAEPKFAEPPAFDVCLKVKSDQGEEDWWRGEFSMNYGKGNFAGKTQAQITTETLQKLGLQNGDMSKLASLVGMKTTVWVKATEKDGKTYYNVKSIGESDFEPTSIDGNEIQKRMAALMNPAAAQPQNQSNPFGQFAAATAGQPANVNPFAKR